MSHAFKSKKRFLKLCQPILELFNQLPSHLCKMVEETSYFFPFFDGAVFTQSGNFAKGSR
jgi:hypothetical protein